MTRTWLMVTAAAGLLAATEPALAVCDLAASDALHAGDGPCTRAWLDANLRLNQLQFVGTAESYKSAPSGQMLSLISMGGTKDAEALDFSEPPLAQQLDTGARALEFDVAYDPHGGLFKNPAGASMAGELLDPAYVAAMSQPGFKVIHVLDVDFRSNCLTLRDCLTEVVTWSRTHPGHLPILIALHANDSKTPMPGATKPLPFDAAAFAQLDAEIRSVFQPEELITPDEVKGAYPTLREAAQAGAWPSLAQARGKVIFLLDDTEEKTALYAGPANNLEGRPLFIATAENSPLASFICVDDPLKDEARIESDVAQGFIVKTRADQNTREARDSNTARRDAAFASGAQFVVTDFLLPDKKIGTYQVKLAAPVQCDARLARGPCASNPLLIVAVADYGP
ncbi:MAG TPA: Ca2+-dependent phosphoinositide-specific phospholipase C [Rhizomicrobium sp.]|nr:Ca2+-dependent phosphoinositide-specific phospholipase C [Rhizomicrobium sp.]